MIKGKLGTATLLLLALGGAPFEASARAAPPTGTILDQVSLQAPSGGNREVLLGNELDGRCNLPHDESRCCGCLPGGCCHCCKRVDDRRFRLTEFNIYPTFSYLGDQSATYNEFEFASHTDLGFLEMENRTVLNVADLRQASSWARPILAICRQR